MSFSCISFLTVDISTYSSAKREREKREYGLLFKTSHHPRTLGPTQLKRTIPPLFLLLPVKSPALVGPPPSSSGSDRLCSVLRPLPAKTRRDSILPAPLFLPCHFYLMLWPRISAVFERYGRRVSFLSTLPREVRETGSEIYDTTRPPPPHAVAHGEERETRPGERERREGIAAKREREERRGEERERGERRHGRERRSRRLGHPVSGNSLQGFASRFLMREKEVGACFYRGRGRENPRVPHRPKRHGRACGRKPLFLLVHSACVFLRARDAL
ncbi:hypothetical protein IGI04_030588, partial [Brassica rapa subsp. trilocularis]